MNETKTIDKPLPPTPFRLLEGDTTTATVKIEAPQDLTIRVVTKDAKGLVVFKLENPRADKTPPTLHRGRTPLPYAVKLEDGGDIFVMGGLNEGDCITIGKVLKQGKAWVSIAGTVPATPENCAVYSEAFGVKVTPHPVWGLPSLERG